MEMDFIKKTIESLLNKLAADAKLESAFPLHGGEITKFSIKTNEPFLLIGREGKTLMAMNHLVKKMFENEIINKGYKHINFIIDVNDYQEKRIEEIKNKANIIAERARFFKNNVEMSPMNPYERMIAHSIFTNTPDIETESVGRGRERRVVVKYIDTTSSPETVL
ncbi:MAG: R3H domain-containing nucleic acid-binding protein [Candidatus Paceibacterota bacterium]